jgi:rod shape-determining protein MreC
MNNFIRFIVRNHHFFIFLIVEFIAFTLIVQYNQYHRATFLNKAGAALGVTYAVTNDIEDFFYLRKSNEELAKQNAHILNTLKSAYKENKVSYKEIYDSVYFKQWNYMGAKVINNSVNKQNNYLTIDKGERQGVKKSMGVVGPNGIVGVVRHVSNNFATVVSLLNPNFSISARLTNTKYFGALHWDGINPRFCWLDDIPNHIKVEVGDSVETSGYSAIFPGRIPIGKVVEAKKDENSNFYHIKVDLFIEMGSLTYVYVVENYLRDEIISLEGKVKVND